MMKQIKKDHNKMDMQGHMKELKKRVLTSVTFFIVAFLCCLYFCEPLMNFIFQLGRNAGYEFIYISPQEVLVQQLRISGVFALISVLPVILFEITRFISPVFDFKFATLKLFLIEIVGIGMFGLGVLFAYKILLPFTYSYLFKIGMSSGILAQISVAEYISLFLTIMLCIGVIFEIPLISVILSKFGLINAEIMMKGRGVVIVLIFIIAAIITPPDIISQCIVAVPMIILYQVSIWLCKIFKSKK